MPGAGGRGGVFVVSYIELFLLMIIILFVFGVVEGGFVIVCLVRDYVEVEF